MLERELIEAIDALLYQMDKDTITALYNVLLRMSDKNKNAAPS